MWSQQHLIVITTISTIPTGLHFKFCCPTIDESMLSNQLLFMHIGVGHEIFFSKGIVQKIAIVF